jgi:hypothetical protein
MEMLMKYLNLILLLMFLIFENCCNVFADNGEVNLSSDLVRKIIEGHKFIEQSTVCLSGTVIEFERAKLELNSDPASIKYSPSKRYRFYKKHDLARVEYIRTQEGTQIAPDHKYNDVTWMLLRSKDYDYNYFADVTTGNPSASVTRSKRPDHFVDTCLQTDLYRRTSSLTTLPGFKVVDMLQRPIGKIETREYDGVPNALWISGVEEIAKEKNGDKKYANMLVVLDTNHHYALLYHEFYIKYDDNNYFIHSTNKIKSHITDSNAVVPKEIIEDCYVKDDGRYIDRYTVDIESTDAPDDALFSESSFKDTGRNYILTDESSDGIPTSKQYIDVPQPWLKKTNSQNEVSFVYYIDWTRVCLVLAVFFILIIVFFLFRRSKKNENNLQQNLKK